MALPTNKPNDPHKKLKVALIPVLLCVFAGVLYDPQDAPPSDDPIVERPKADPAAARRATEADLAKMLNRLKTRRTPQVDYEDIVSYDPFRDLPILRSLVAPRVAATASPRPGGPVIVADKDGGFDADAVAAVKPPEAELLPALEPRTFEEIKSILQTRNVSAILHGPTTTSAIVDARIVHVGDLLEPGIRVVAIEPTGIVVRLEPD